MENSRFKFRVWDKEFKCWDKEPADRWQSSLICNMLDAGLTYDFGGPFLQRLRFELVQSTGLYDCEGRDIFEGDILECELRENEIVRGVVVWNKDRARFRTISLDGDDWASWFDIIIHKPNNKVIGNRFENPELLEVRE